jgi:hypothetical protein
VNVTEQLAVVPLPESGQVADEKLPAWLLANVAVPAGVIGVPGLVSTTVTVHVIGLWERNGDAHDRAVEILRVPTVSTRLALLTMWLLSPR